MNLTPSTGLQLWRTSASSSYVNKAWKNIVENIKISLKQWEQHVIPVRWSTSKQKETQVFMSCDTNTGQNHIIKIANKSFENWAKLKYLGIMATNQNCTHAEIMSRLK